MIMRTAAAIFAVVTAFSIHADLTIRTSPGTLDRHKAELECASGKVVLEGSLDASDFQALGALTSSVDLLDISGTTIVATSRHKPDAQGHYMYPAHHVPDHAFFNSEVKEIILPETCEIGEGTFANARTEKVTLSKHTMRIPDHAFYGSSVKEVANTGHVRWIGKEAFTGCNIITLSFPNLDQASDFAMAGMPELREVTLPKTARLGKGVLMDCPKLARIKGDVRILPDYFSANSNLSALPPNTSAMGEYAFANSSAETLTLASGLMSVADGACMGMTSLKEIYAAPCGPNPPAVSPDAFHGLNVGSIRLHVLPGTIDIWKNHETWGKFDILESLDSVDELESDVAGITISLRGGMVEIESSYPISDVEAFNQSGSKTYHEVPASMRHSIPVSDIKAHGAVLIRATNSKGSKVLKIML